MEMQTPDPAYAAAENRRLRDRALELALKVTIADPDPAKLVALATAIYDFIRGDESGSGASGAAADDQRLSA